MKHLFVPYELAVKLKEKGFDEPCITKFETYIDKTKLYPVLGALGLNTPYENEYHGYDQRIINDTERRWVFTGYKNSVLDHGNSIITAPLYQQVIDWFREEHVLFIVLEPCISANMVEYEWDFSIQGAGLSGKKLPQYLDASKGYLTSTEEGMDYYEALDKAIEEALKLIP